MPRRSKNQRFRLRTSLGEEGLPKATDPEVALSTALTRASTHEAEPGTWEVMEYEDVLYRVHRLDNPELKLDVRVEVPRG